MRRLWSCTAVVLVGVTSKAWAAPTVLPGVTQLQALIATFSSVYVPIIMAAILIGFLIAMWRYGDNESWLAGFLKVGFVTALAGNAVTLVTFFMAGTPAAGATLDLLGN